VREEEEAAHPVRIATGLDLTAYLSIVPRNEPYLAFSLYYCDISILKLNFKKAFSPTLTINFSKK
jgi:hypothetical protein